MSDGKTDAQECFSEWEKYIEAIKKTHLKAMNEKDYMDLIAAEKCIKQLIDKQWEVLEGIIDKKLEILKKYGWENNWKHSDLKRQDEIYGWSAKKLIEIK